MWQQTVIIEQIFIFDWSVILSLVRDEKLAKEHNQDGTCVWDQIDPEIDPYNKTSPWLSDKKLNFCLYVIVSPSRTKERYNTNKRL